jgi:Holliday junction resolvase-like predicted endonuclease
MDIIRRHQLGRDSEARALEWFLKNRKASFLSKNYRARCGEIDLVFEETLPCGSIELVFVEVRSCSDQNWINGPRVLTLKSKKS